jgi:fructose-bisphosphate aldolase class II
MRILLDHAAENNYGLAAFNVNNMEQIQAIMEAAQETDSPVIVQASRGARSYTNDAYLRHLMLAAAELNPKLPIAMHQDHGNSPETCASAIAQDFTSVMMDGSLSPDGKTPSTYDYNVAVTRKVVKLAHAKGVTVEGEIGTLGGIEDGHGAGLTGDEALKHLTDPAQAQRFVADTGVDALAVAIGTSHGAYKFKHEAKLAMGRIEQTMKTCPGLPLVMHGSSSVPKEFIDLINKYGGKMPNAMGVPEDQIHLAVSQYGVCKVNIDTDLRLALTAKIREVFATKPTEFDPRNYLGPGREAIVSMVKHKLHVLNCAGKAEAVINHWKKLGEPLPIFYARAGRA